MTCTVICAQGTSTVHRAPGSYIKYLLLPVIKPIRIYKDDIYRIIGTVLTLEMSMRLNRDTTASPNPTIYAIN